MAAWGGAIAPAQVSRVLLLILVAAGALVSIATTGVVSHFAGGFAVGAGAVLVLSRIGLAGNESPSPPKEGTP
jgi:hypothetical protein